MGTTATFTTRSPISDAEALWDLGGTDRAIIRSLARIKEDICWAGLLPDEQLRAEIVVTLARRLADQLPREVA